jgi:hypothetical protein
MFAMLLGACPDLVKEDDPRNVVGGGSGDGGMQGCIGSPVFCEDRSQSQCNSGCTFEPNCHSPTLERCAGYRNPTTCDADAACHWQLDTCKSDIGGCSAYESQTACQNDPLHQCIWGPACAGERRQCFEIQTSAACTANLGCTWSPG